MLRIQCLGYLGKDAVMRQHGIENVLNFSIAHTDKYKDNGVLKERTTWVSCSWWVDGQSKVGQYLKKGTLAWVEGFPEAKMWENQDGKKTCGLTLRVIKMELLGGKKEGSQDATTQKEPKVEDEGFTPYSDEPPF
jgi:single-strand DNA-binding protein